EEARGAADQGAAWKRRPRHRLPSPGGDGARAVGEPLSAGERVGDKRMGLEALELVEGGQGRIRVVEVNHKSDRDQVVVIVIEKGSSARAPSERPAEGMLHQAVLKPLGIDLPQFLDADSEFLRIAALVQFEAL